MPRLHVAEDLQSPLGLEFFPAFKSIHVTGSLYSQAFSLLTGWKLLKCILQNFFKKRVEISKLTYRASDTCDYKSVGMARIHVHRKNLQNLRVFKQDCYTQRLGLLNGTFLLPWQACCIFMNSQEWKMVIPKLVCCSDQYVVCS